MASDAASDEREERIAEILSSCSDRINSGQAVDMPALLAANKDLLPELQLALETIGLAQAPPPEGLDREALGNHRIVREIGRGGMGIVYEAIDLSLNRRVALKMLPGSKSMDPGRRERFLREARASARLHHTRIVPVFEVGEAEGTLYFAMQYISGCGLDRVIRELRQASSSAREAPGDSRDSATRIARRLADRYRGTPEDERHPASPFHVAAARMGSEIADALAHAHSQGILHRDVKPSNVIVDIEGAAWLVDFGLAKSEFDAESLTQSGDLVGTVAYMPPERLRGEGDHRGDVYSLGATLYELLALRPAFEESDRHRLFKKILAEDPPRLASLAPGVPRELETIVAKAMAREPSRRFSTAAAMRDDLLRFVRGEPILTRPTGAVERSLLWCRRNPVVSSLGGAIVLLLAVLLAVATVSARRLREQLYDSELSRAQARRVSGQTGRRFESLSAIERAAQIHPSDALRDEAIAALGLADLRETAAPPVSFGTELRIAYDDDLERYAVMDPVTRLVTIHAIPSGERLAAIGDPQAKEEPRGFTGDGRSLLTTFERGGARFLRLRALPSGELRHERPTSPGYVAFAFTEGDTVLACGESDGSIALVDVAAGAVRRKIQPRVPPQWIGISAALKKLLAFGPPGRQVEILDLSEAGARVTIDARSGVSSAALSADGKLLALGGAGSSAIELWRIDTVERVRVLTGHLGGGIQIAFRPTGAILASTSWDSTLRLWDWGSGDLLLTHPVLTGTPRWSRSGNRLLVAHPYRWLGFEFDAGEVRRVLRILDAPDSAGSGWSRFDPSSRILLTGYGAWDAVRGEEIAPGAITRAFENAWLHPDGRSLVAATSRGVFRRSFERGAVDDAELLRVGASSPVGDLATGTWYTVFDRSGRRLAAIEPGFSIVVVPWDGTGSKRVLGTHSGADQLSWSADGVLLASGTFNRGLGVKVWHVQEARQLQEFHVAAGARGHFDPRGRWLAIAAQEEYRFRRIGGEDPLNWPEESIHRRSVPTIVPSAFAWSPDGSAAALEDSLGVVLLLDPQTGRRLGRFETSHRRAVYYLEVSPDHRFLAASCANASTELWDLAQLRAGLRRLGLDLDLPSIPAVLESAATGLNGPLRVELSGDGESDAVPPPVIPRDPRDLLRQALEFQRRGAWKEAIERYDAILKLDPDDPGALNNLAWIFTIASPELRDPRRALELAERAVRVGGETAASLNTLGAAQHRAGNPRAAVDTLLRSAQQSGGATAWDGFFFAMSFRALGFDSLAREHLAASLRWIDRSPDLSKEELRELTGLRREVELLLDPADRESDGKR